jgi:N-acetylglutamate synthase-like GNAT family acetyltransferase
MQAVRPGLTITPVQLAEEEVVVAERDGEVLGFYALALSPPGGELTNLWVDPHHIGSGTGRLMFERAVATARARGVERLRIDAEPHAEPFYRRMGAVQVDSRPSQWIPGRSLPLMEIRLTGPGR